MLKGIDVSHYQRVTDWPLVASSNDFIIFKASEGLSTDPSFAGNVVGARENAMSFGGYHFLHPADPAGQLDHFSRTLDAALYGESNFWPSVDVEEEKSLAPFTAEVYMKPVDVFIEGLIARYGKAIVYTSQYYWRCIGNPEVLLRPEVLLWVSHYTTALEPAVPMGKQYTLWQNVVTQAPGVASQDGAVDHDMCPGELPVMVGTLPIDPPIVGSPLV